MCKEVLSSVARKMVFSVQSLSSLCLCGYFLLRQVKPRRHRELKGYTEKNWLSVVVLLLFASVVMFAQSPSPTPVDKRGLGIQSPSSTTSTTTDQRAREAKPELVLQTGYNNLFGATRMVFSPDGKLLATGTYRSNTIKLWETATNRKLRDLTSSGQITVAIAPAIAFSRDSRLIAASGSDNSVTVWDVLSGRELQHLGGSGQGSIMGALGV